jgi:hypothetical protein
MNKRVKGSIILVGIVGAAIALALTNSTARPALGSNTEASSASSSSLADTLQTMALSDLHTLSRQVAFRPFLPPQLALPVDHHFDRVVWVPSSSVTQFGIFISSSDNPSAGHDAIHLDEWLVSSQDVANSRNPMVAFASVIKPVHLANGTWYEMQQPQDPDKGEWILMAQFGHVFIQMDGLDGKAALEEFAGRLTPS